MRGALSKIVIKVGMAAVIGASVLTAAAPAAVAAPGTCHDVYFIAARGSGGAYSGPTVLSTSPELQAVETGMSAALTAAGSNPDILIHQLSYPAPSVDLLASGLNTGSLTKRVRRLLQHNVPAYLDSERQGEA